MKYTKLQRLEIYKKAIQIISENKDANTFIGEKCGFATLCICWAISSQIDRYLVDVKAHFPELDLSGDGCDFPDMGYWRSRGYAFPLTPEGHQKRIEVLQNAINKIQQNAN